MKLYLLDYMGALAVDPITRAPRFTIVEDDGETQEMAAPPALEPLQAALPTDGGWLVVPDHRGELWSDSEGKPVKIAVLGDPAGLGLTPIDPTTANPSSAGGA